MLKLAAPLVALTLLLTACGGDDSDDASTNAGTGSSGGPTLAISADPNGGLKFTEDQLTAPAGTVRIEFTNDSSTPHDVVIERDGEDVAKTDVVTDDTASTDAELTAGQYTFYCSVGGHRQAGMEGTLTVE